MPCSLAQEGRKCRSETRLGESRMAGNCAASSIQEGFQPRATEKQGSPATQSQEWVQVWSQSFQSGLHLRVWASWHSDCSLVSAWAGGPASHTQPLHPTATVRSYTCVILSRWVCGKVSCSVENGYTESTWNLSTLNQPSLADLLPSFLCNDSNPHYSGPDTSMRFS